MAGEYEKVQLLGSGSFGKAWLVNCTKKKRQAVLKEIKTESLSDREMEQALVEVKILAKCRHVNIIAYFDAFMQSGSLQIAMEYADGGDLQKKITAQRGLFFSKEVVLDWFIQLCFALRYLHSENILHRDLKPQNLFLASDGVVKVGDFGISRILLDSADHAFTAIGTPYYLSPEICQRKAYNFKSDMWAVGCVLYELCCLRVPFQASNLPLLVLKIMDGCFEPIPSDYGTVVEDLVKMLLSSDPQKRPSAEEVLRLPAFQRSIKTTFKKCVAHRQRQESQRKLILDWVSGSSEDSVNQHQATPKVFTVKSPVGQRLSAATPKIKAALKRNRAIQSAKAVSHKRQKKEKVPSANLFQEMLARQSRNSSSSASFHLVTYSIPRLSSEPDAEYPDVFADEPENCRTLEPAADVDCGNIASTPNNGPRHPLKSIGLRRNDENCSQVDEKSCRTSVGHKNNKTSSFSPKSDVERRKLFSACKKSFSVDSNRRLPMTKISPSTAKNEMHKISAEPLPKKDLLTHNKCSFFRGRQIKYTDLSREGKNDSIIDKKNDSLEQCVAAKVRPQHLSSEQQGQQSYLYKPCCPGRPQLNSATYILLQSATDSPMTEKYCSQCKREGSSERCALQALYSATALSHRDRLEAQRCLSRFLINHLGSDLSLCLCTQVTSNLHAGEDYCLVEKSVDTNLKVFLPAVFQLLVFSASPEAV